MFTFIFVYIYIYHGESIGHVCVCNIMYIYIHTYIARPARVVRLLLRAQPPSFNYFQRVKLLYN